MDDTDEQHILPVIMCGGAGMRLWPRSRWERPKPFLPLVGDQTLFQEAIGRCRGGAFADPVIVTGSAHLDVVAQQLGGASASQVIVEPEPKGTAAAAALAAATAKADQVLLVCPSDHFIDDADAFANAATTAAKIASRGSLVCIGVPAASPQTRFGYVRFGERLEDGVFAVSQFVEKPPLDSATAFVASGEFAWNAGIFAFRADRFLEELRRYRPALAQAVEDAVARGHSKGGRFYPDPVPLSRVDPDSIDRAVMENTDSAVLVMLRSDWSDIGDWSAVHRARAKDRAGNSVVGPAELVDCRDVLVETDGPKVRAVGVEGIVIVVNGDDVLVTRHERG